MTDNFFIDSNILIYAYDKSDVVKNRKAKEILDKCWSGKNNYYISAQNIAEFFVIVTGKIEEKIDYETSEKIIEDFINFNSWKILKYDINTVSKAISLHKKTKKIFWDALLAATMLENNIFHILTENTSDFNKFEGIIAKNPFNS